MSLEAEAPPAEVTAEVAAVAREEREEAAVVARAMELPSSPPTRGRHTSYNVLGLTHPYVWL